MADRNQNANSGNYQSNQDWDQDRDRFNRENDLGQSRNHGNAGYGYNQGRMQPGYGNAGYRRNDSAYGQALENEGGYGGQYGTDDQGRYSRASYIPDNDENHDDYNRDYENTQFGTSGTYGYSDEYEMDYNPGGYSKADDRGSFGNVQGYGNDYRRQDWRRGNVNTGYQNNYNRSFQNRDFGDYGGYGNMSSGLNRNRVRTGYGDMDNYRSQGGYERQNRGRGQNEQSSWPGERGRSTDVQNTGGYKGRGPRDYQRSEERIREDACDRLTDDDMLDATDIRVQVQGNEVILTGTVNSREAKRRAEDVVESVSGVRNIENRIHINWPDNYSANDYTGTTDRVGGIGTESGTTNEVVRNVRSKKTK